MQTSGESTKISLSFEKGYTTMVWITIGCLLEKDIEKVYNAVKESMVKSSVDFFGCSFGRYDVVLEFRNASPRIASWRSLQIQKRLETISRNENDTLGPISCSLSLCKKVRASEVGQTKKTTQHTTLRVYSFMKPAEYSSIQELTRLAKSIDTRPYMRLLWNSSSYNLILSLSGNCYFDIFSDLIQIKQDFPELTSETCTFFVVKWDPNNGFAHDSSLKRNRKILIPALTYVKLKKLADSGFKLQQNDWVKVFNSSSFQFSRPGWLDECFFAEKGTLTEILRSVNRLRQDNMSYIKTTSTIPLLPLEMGKA